jgi:hypothetical protein
MLPAYFLWLFWGWGFKNYLLGWALVAYACNPSYSRVRDQEDRGSKITLGK